MKVCMITTSFPAYKGHIQSPFIYQLARALSFLTDITVVCPFYKRSIKQQERFGDITIERFCYFLRPFQSLTEQGGIGGFRKNPWLFFQMIFFMVSMFFTSLRVSKNCDIIHCQWALSGFIGVFIKKIRKKPLVVTLRGEDIKALDSVIMRPVIRYVMKQADCVTSNNAHHLYHVKDVAKRTLVIRNGIDMNVFTKRNKTLMKRKLKLHHKMIIMYVGWFVERKGISYLLRAVPDILKQHPDTLFIFFGEGPLLQSLLREARKLRIENSVLFLNSQPSQKIAQYMNAADVFVLPSLGEGLPNVVLEAFFSGLPVVATDIAGTSEVVKHRITGLLIPPKNPSKIAESVNLILGDTTMAKKLSVAALHLMKQEGQSWNDCAQRHVDVYNDIYS